MNISQIVNGKETWKPLNGNETEEKMEMKWEFGLSRGWQGLILLIYLMDMGSYFGIHQKLY